MNDIRVVAGTSVFCALAIVLLLLGACSSDDSIDPSGGNGATGGNATGGSGGGIGGDGGSGGSIPPGPVSITLPQVVDGAALGNQSVQATLPLHVATVPQAATVAIDFNGGHVEGLHAGGGVFIAELPVTGLPDGALEVSVVATSVSDDETTDKFDLVLSAAGVQLTDFSQVGFAGTPRVHQRNGELWLTWTDRSDTDAEAWLRRIDGAARWIGDKIRLVGAGEETLYARPAFGSSSIGVLYQGHGGPYANHFKIVDFDGTELLAPIDLDPVNMYGSYGGDIFFDGTHFVIVWRINDGNTNGEIRWMRIEEASPNTVTGPSTVAVSGNEDPHGKFLPISFISVGPMGSSSLVTFARDHYHSTLDMAVMRAQAAVVDNGGNIVSERFMGAQNGYDFDREARVFNMGDQAVVVWSALDLLDPGQNPPYLWHALASSNGALDGDGTLMEDTVDDRDEPYLVPNDDHFGVMMWTDHRSYTQTPSSGRIELMAAPVDATLALAAEPTVFGHARFIAGTAQTGAAQLGSNAFMIWIDERHGNGLFDPKPEMYVDTAWY